jgi:hypothetical protein
MLCWLTNPVPFSANYLENLKELFASTREIHVVVGVPAQGPAGFRRSHLAAVDAYQVASASARNGVTGFADVGVLALLTADQERASCSSVKSLASWPSRARPLTTCGKRRCATWRQVAI